MRQVVKDALDASTLSEAGRRRVLAVCAERFSYAKYPAPTAIPADELADLIAVAVAEEAANEQDTRTTRRRALDQCYFGTGRPRDATAGETQGISRSGRNKDGWRDHMSQPFTAMVKAGTWSDVDRMVLRDAGLLHLTSGDDGRLLNWDVFPDEPELTRKQYDALVALIDAGLLG